MCVCVSVRGNGQTHTLVAYRVYITLADLICVMSKQMRNSPLSL